MEGSPVLNKKKETESRRRGGRSRLSAPQTADTHPALAASRRCRCRGSSRRRVDRSEKHGPWGGLEGGEEEGGGGGAGRGIRETDSREERRTEKMKGMVMEKREDSRREKIPEKREESGESAERRHLKHGGS